MSIIDKTPPTSEPSERALLASLMVSATDPFVVIEGHVDAADFSDEGFGKLFAAMKLIHESGKPVNDPAVLLAELPALKVPPSAFNFSFLMELLGLVSHAGALVYYADEIRSQAQKRRIITAASRALEAAYDPRTEPETLIGGLEAELARLSANAPSGVVGLEEAMRQVASTAREELDRPIRSACGWGIPSIDAAVGPLMRGELIVVGARPGSGKTAFAMQVAAHAADHDRRTFFASLEMQATEVAEREICRMVDLDSRKLRSGQISREMVDKLETAAASIVKSPVRIWSPPSATFSQIRGMAKHEHAKEPLSLVVVDFLQLVDAEISERGLTRASQVGNVANGLRKLAKELFVPVLALSQLNRGEKNAPPTLASLRESGEIEQAANVVLFLHPNETRRPGEPVAVSAIAAKVRAGELGAINLVFHPMETRFSEPTQPVQASSARRNSILSGYQDQGRF